MDNSEPGIDELHASLGEYYHIPDDERDHSETILHHQDGNTSDLNRALVTNRPLHRHEILKNEFLEKAVDYLVSNSGTGPQYHFKTYSGVSTAHGHILKGLKEHDTASFPAWTSSSIDRSVADQFSMSGHVAVFNIRPGFKHGAYIGHNSDTWKDEREFLIKPNSNWRKVGEQTIERKRAGDAHPMKITYHHFEPVTE